MRLTKKINSTDDSQPPVHKPVPMRSNIQALPDDRDHLADLSRVAKRLGVSKRYVQTLVRRKVIPVIRLGRRCTRFDLDSVMHAVKRFEIREVR